MVVMTRVLTGLTLPLTLMAAIAVAPGPALAQLWPNGSGPSLDLLRNTIDQYQRLGPPPVDAERVASLPPLPAYDSRVDVGTPVLALPVEPQARTRGPTTTRRGVRRASTRRDGSARTVRRSDESSLERDIAAQERRLEDLQRRLDAERSRLETTRRGGGLSSFNPIPPAAAATLPPSAPPPTATLR